MNRPIEQVLSTLLPTHADELPPELVRLAQSLVAQSRSFSTTLKPEEEIARPYACAEIACKRYELSYSPPMTLLYFGRVMDWRLTHTYQTGSRLETAPSPRSPTVSSPCIHEAVYVSRPVAS
jgi:hypothetical protein